MHIGIFLHISCTFLHIHAQSCSSFTFMHIHAHSCTFMHNIQYFQMCMNVEECAWMWRNVHGFMHKFMHFLTVASYSTKTLFQLPPTTILYMPCDVMMSIATTLRTLRTVHVSAPYCFIRLSFCTLVPGAVCAHSVLCGTMYRVQCGALALW